MRNILAGLIVFGALSAGTAVPATARPLAGSLAIEQPSAVQQVRWDGCGSRCQDHRRWVRERSARHWRYDQHRHWQESHRDRPAYGYLPRY